MRRYLLSLALASISAMPVAAQVTVTTGAPAQDIGPLGRDFSLGTLPTAYAQTFTAPGGTNNLRSFSFYITGGYGGGSSLMLTASVYLFSVDHLVGNALFSTTLTGSDNLFSEDLKTFGSAASPLNVSLGAGNIYAFVLSAAEQFQLTPDGSTNLFGAMTTNAYANGSLFMSQAQNAGALKVGGAFAAVDGAPDAAFSAVFTNVVSSVVPEPASVVLIGSGLALLAVVSVRRSRRSV